MEEYVYTPNEISSDMFLSEIPLSLMKENIRSQFEDPLEYRKKDHLTTFFNMYHYSKDNADVYEEEDLENIYELRDDFYGFMLNLFRQSLGIGIDRFDELSEDEKETLIHFTYRFFITNIKKNFVCYIINIINNNKERFAPSEDEKKKDVTTLSFKREITDPTDISILSNLSQIINEILSDEIDIEDFFEYCDDDDCLETRIVSKAYDTYQMTGNFVPLYIDMLDSDFHSEIESKVRNRILKKYKSNL